MTADRNPSPRLTAPGATGPQSPGSPTSQPTGQDGRTSLSIPAAAAPRLLREPGCHKRPDPRQPPLPQPPFPTARVSSARGPRGCEETPGGCAASGRLPAASPRPCLVGRVPRAHRSPAPGPSPRGFGRTGPWWQAAESVAPKAG